jgi:hypothetical protein
MTRQKKKKKQTRKTGKRLASAQVEPQSAEVQSMVVNDRVEGPNPSSMSISSSELHTILWVGFLVLVGIFYGVFKAFSMHPYPGDEYIYLYQAKLVSEGVSPYSEFAMAHPPAQAIFTALILRLFGYNFLLGRLLPALWCLAGGMGLAVMVKREYGFIASGVSCALYLFAHEPLRASSHFTGVNMTVALIIFALLAFRAERQRTAALFFVISVFTRLYAIPAVLVTVIYSLLSNQRNAGKLILWGAIFGAVALTSVLIWTGPSEMFHNLLLYHAQKTPMSETQLLGMTDKVLFHNSTLGLLFALGGLKLAIVIIRSFLRQTVNGGVLHRISSAVRGNHLDLLILSSFIAIFYIVMLKNMDRVWMYYFIPAFPFAAVVAGWLVSGWVRACYRFGLQQLRGVVSNEFAVFPFWGEVALLAVFTVGFIRAPSLEERLGYFQQEMQKPPAERRHHYTFQGSPLPDSIDDIVRYLFWKDTRVIGERYNAFDYVLWHESRVFDIVEDATALIEHHTSPSGEIFGDSGTVPLFALLTSRRIAGNEVDTNIQRYRSGNADPRDLIARIDKPSTELIILRHNFGVYGVKEVRGLVKDKYRRIKTLQSAQGKVFHFFKRKTDR